MIVGSTKEDLLLEKRVSLTPETAKNIISLGLKVCVEKDYASHIGIQDKEYQDAGVDGKKKKYGKRKSGLPTFSYKDKMPPPKKLDKWVVRKGLKGTRDAKGRFVGRKALTFIIARSIFMKGLEPTYFFTNAFDAAYKKLPKEFIDKYELDIDNFLKFTTK